MTNAIFFDGLSARLHPVQLATTADGIVVAGDGVARVYTRAQARLAEPFEQAAAVLYFHDGARCEVGGAARAALADALGYRKSLVARWQACWPAALAALVLLLALLGAALRWGLPAAAEAVAQRLPASVDVRLGASVLSGLERRGMLLPTRLSDERVAELERILGRVLPARPRLPIRLRLYDAPGLGENALALPDGTVVLTDQMVRLILGKAATFGDAQAAQVAGVLAHEIGHVELRHSTRVLARTSLTAALSATLFGDFSAVAAGVPAVLMNLRYSREMESEADGYAIAALQARHIPLAPLAELFEELEQTPAAVSARDLPRWLSNTLAYAASHPATTARIERLRAADAGHGQQAVGGAQ